MREMTSGWDEHDTPEQGHTFIQWKGTEVCMDVWLPCGCMPHIDASFAYFIRCDCGHVYQVGQSVKLRQVTDEELASWRVDDGVIVEGD